MTPTDRALLDQPTYFEKCSAAVDKTFAQYCAICGFTYGEHSGLPNFISGRVSCCPNGHGGYATLSTFHKYSECEGSIPEYNDPEGVNSKPCKSNFGTYRPEQEQVLCDGCAEGL